MRILIAGDFYPCTRIARLIEENRFEEILGEVKPIIESADYSLVKFECAVVENPQARPISKCGPNLQCTNKAVDIVGVGNNLKDAATIFYKKIEGEIVAFINCCEHEFSITTDVQPGANPLNSIELLNSIREASLRADYVIVIVHSGHEYFQRPSPRMKELYRFFVDCGADVVSSHHQHCFSGYEVYNGKPLMIKEPFLN